MTRVNLSLIILIVQICFVLSDKTTVKPVKNKIQKIKNSLEKNLLYANNYQDLVKHGIQIQRGPSSIMGRSGLNPAAIVSGDVKDATPGRCDPKPVCISNPLTLNLNSNQLPFPQCINIHRCEGCCPTNEKCVPTKTHEVKLQKVGIINIDEENNLRYNETMVSVSNHTECQCQCQWDSDEDCKQINANYVKNPYACECVCPDEITCDAYHEFDTESCGCKCKKDKFGRMEQLCKGRSGFVWNDILCKCDQMKMNMMVKEVKIAK